MWTILILLVFCILSLYFYLPLPVIVILFAALFSGAAVTLWFARTRGKHATSAKAVGERETDCNS
jgi:uncharacterized membrane protein YccC